ncbi:hypothetical protein BC938DRAFT_472248 [Jimgerdemannia flammicorona]|uniref:Uncharacterized protein n=1 Tax=Jimgerdemannia flammicorona TaxID=994334 RepID=A0A433QU18_9FUNG|nr:hypothetical protein BC938DRAFT_472248 [Jimgerdemannia flammicorona]
MIYHSVLTPAFFSGTDQQRSVISTFGRTRKTSIGFRCSALTKAATNPSLLAFIPFCSALDPDPCSPTPPLSSTVGTIANQNNYSGKWTYERPNRDAVVTDARELAASATDVARCIFHERALSPGGFSAKDTSTKREAEKILVGDEFKGRLWASSTHTTGASLWSLLPSVPSSSPSSSRPLNHISLTRSPFSQIGHVGFGGCA